MCVCMCVCYSFKIQCYLWEPITFIGSIASFLGLQSPNAVEGLVKLLRRMTSGKRWVDVGGVAYMPCIYRRRIFI